LFRFHTFTAIAVLRTPLVNTRKLNAAIGRNKLRHIIVWRGMTSVHLCCSVVVLMLLSCARAEDQIWFGTIDELGTTSQARFEVSIEGDHFRKIVLAPYGLTPTPFKLVVQHEGVLQFSLDRRSKTYQCALRKETRSSFRGSCRSADSRSFSIVMREFAQEDAALQGNTRTADERDIAIVARARELLSDGRSWNRRDDRVCDNSGYPYRWSLFCALHQASIEIGSQYEHLRPVMKSVRQAITDRHPNRKFAHTLRDFNNNAAEFRAISSILDEANALLIKQTR
jgi:hypothetical protein